MLVAILLMGILTSITVINYHYFALQRHVDHELETRFLAQAMAKMSKNRNASFNQGTLSRNRQEIKIVFNNGDVVRLSQ